MAKSKLFAQQPPFDFGKTVPVAVKKTEGGTLVAHLQDGTTLEIKILLLDVKRSTDRHNDKGGPVYACTMAQTTHVKIPKKLLLVKGMKK